MGVIAVAQNSACRYLIGHRLSHALCFRRTSLGRCSFGPLRVVQRVVLFASGPQPMHQYCQPASHPDSRSFFGCAASPLCVGQAPAPQVRVRSVLAEDVVRALNQQPSQHAVTGLGDVLLRVVFTAAPLPTT